MPVTDTLRGPVYDLQIAAENMGHTLTDEDVKAIHRDRVEVVPLKVLIGARYTGRHEYFRNTRTGEYSESLPPMTFGERLLQVALCPPGTVRRRPEDVRQKETQLPY